MIYKNLPPVGGHVLPAITWTPTTAFSSRGGRKVETAFAHRWGVSDWRHERIQGVINTFQNVANQASSHIVYAGEVGFDAGECVQMVRLADKAWTEGAFNSEGVSVELGDAMWLGADPEGFCVAARIFGWLLKHCDLNNQWVKDPHTHNTGISRHGDGGVDGGGHTSCPTSDLELWGQFVARVKAEYKRGGYRTVWAR